MAERTSSNTSVIKRSKKIAGGRRSLSKVPYVEMWGGRVQGVVSSGSSAERVYVSWVEGESGDFYCSTNNNRKCGGLRGSSCKHIDAMIAAAIDQYSGDVVARYLGFEGKPEDFKSARSITSRLIGSSRKEQAGDVFSRFLNYLHYMELPSTNVPIPEMTFFMTG